MMNRLNGVLSSLATSVLAALSAPVLGAAVWDFSVCNGTTFAAGTAAGAQSGAGAVGNGYACAANGSTTRDLAVSAWGAVSTADNVFATAFLTSLGVEGFGVGALSEGGSAVTGTNGALDNDPSSLAPNLILLQFGAAVLLEEVTLGWSMNDADLTIMAYTGSGTPSDFLVGRTTANLTAGGPGAGWSLIEDVGDPSPDTAYATSGANITHGVNGAGVASAYWLISAHAQSLGGGPMDSLVDYVALLGVKTRNGPPPPQVVAVPGTFALLGIGLAGLAAWRQPSRRRA